MSDVFIVFITAILPWEKKLSENHFARYFVINELARKLTYTNTVASNVCDRCSVPI